MYEMSIELNKTIMQIPKRNQLQRYKKKTTYRKKTGSKHIYTENNLYLCSMISKNKLKYIHSLEQKKNRYKEGIFIAEGIKIVNELLCAGFIPRCLIGTELWFDSIQQKISCETEKIIVSEDELRKASFLQHPQQVMGLFSIPNHNHLLSDDYYRNNLCLVLDNVQDPGNLGTIIRIADWFGITTIICSRETVDAYSPKVVQATMGSIARVRIIYTDLNSLLSSLPSDTPVYGTLLDGENIYSTALSENGLIIMGNEGNGISASIRPLINRKLLIPPYPAETNTAESLNVAIATAITVAEFRRRNG